MMSWKSVIALFFVPIFVWCVGLALGMYPRVLTYLKLYLVLPLRSRGEAFSGSEPMTDAERDRLPKEQRDALEAGIRRLEPLGFVRAGLSRCFSDTGWAVGATLFNEGDGASAQVAATWHERRDMPPLGSESVGFLTEFTDDTAIVTTNFWTGIFRPDPLCDAVRWPGMRDLDVLYRLHTARVARDGAGRRPKLPPRDGVLAHAVYQETKTMWRQVDAGYCWFDSMDEVFRRTLKGGFVFYWKLLWPWKQLRTAREEQKLRQVLRELGMGTPEAYSSNPKDEVKPALSYHSETAS